MVLVDAIRQLWGRKSLLALTVCLALSAAVMASYRVSVSPLGLHQRTLTVAAASSQILVDSPRSTLVNGASLGTFDALATRAKIYGQYLASLAARNEIARRAGVPADSIATSGPFSPDTGQVVYPPQSSGERAGELLQEGAPNRLVFTAQEGVPILSVDVQAENPGRAVALASASFQTLRDYVRGLRADGEPVRKGVTVRELGAPEGGTLGGSNHYMLGLLAALLVFGLGCATILTVPRFARYWQALDSAEAGPPTAPPAAQPEASPPPPSPFGGHGADPHDPEQVGNGGRRDAAFASRPPAATP
jgi:hypothetical protein